MYPCLHRVHADFHERYQRSTSASTCPECRGSIPRKSTVCLLPGNSHGASAAISSRGADERHSDRRLFQLAESNFDSDSESDSGNDEALARALADMSPSPASRGGNTSQRAAQEAEDEELARALAASSLARPSPRLNLFPSSPHAISPPTSRPPRLNPFPTPPTSPARRVHPDAAKLGLPPYRNLYAMVAEEQRRARGPFYWR